MQRKNIAMTVASALALTGTATAGGGVYEENTGNGGSLLGAATGAVSGVANSLSGDWCEALKGGLPKYKGDNAFIQEVKFFGRFQYQYGYTEGDYAGTSFDSNGHEIRRARLGTQIKFLNGFKLKGNVDLEKGGYRQDQFGYSGFDELYLSYGLQDVAGFDNVSVGYGRRKVLIGEEVHESSKKIKTVERSNIANYFYPGRSTGGTVNATRGGVSYGAGVYTTDADETIGQWEGGTAYVLNLGFEAGNGEILLDGIYNDASVAQDQTFGYEWGTSLAYRTSYGSWDLMLNALYGETHNGDAVYGVVIMPSKYLIEDKLEAVLRYQYAGSDGDNLRLTKRYAREGGGGRGDENHTIYAGLNYYLCGNNAKFMLGAEYETLDNIGTANDDADALTFTGAFRMYF